jgi:4-carboxymuconolactone decarboxylase
MKYIKKLENTDTEFSQFFNEFANGEVINEEGYTLDNNTRFLAIIATLLGCQALDLYNDILEDALKYISPVEVKEVVYQATAYLGIGRTYAFINTTNKEFIKLGIQLPLEGQSTTNKDNRREKGTDIQVKYFGEHMKDAYKQSHMNRWLAANCFGDYYTRTGLNDNQREMITFCFILSQGGCEPQLKAHIQANHNIGNNKKFLMSVVSQVMPYIGYPRTLNAINCINEVLKENDE